MSFRVPKPVIVSLFGQVCGSRQVEAASKLEEGPLVTYFQKPKSEADPKTSASVGPPPTTYNIAAISKHIAM